MVGETLLANPCLFADIIPDPVKISLEYLDICHAHPDTATLQTIQTHVRHFVDHPCGRRPWFNKFRATLGKCADIDAIERLLRVKVQRWRGLAPLDPNEELAEAGTSEDDEVPELRVADGAQSRSDDVVDNGLSANSPTLLA
ncbi:hypothetical protein BN946_scf184985.g108 [Trametes cinnabarina]|uniref:Uncharacterized protein n=1 Tax=Pycnoporus cinnabarinus TaxID=5643 RepID=A0A060SJS5_PYCCI|nr:hypothetical protein BN946_scf184985.g108 [Trametes cinnabarina]